MHGRRRAPAIALTLAAALALAGCSFGGDDDAAGATSSDTSSAPATQPSDGAGSASDSPSMPSTPPTAGQSVPDLPVISSRKSTASRLPVVIELNEVVAEGQVMTVTFTARNGSTDPADRWQISNFFSDGVRQPDTDLSTADYASVDGVYVVDAQGGKRYLVARDAQKICVCSTDLSATFAGAGQGVVLSAVFKAPPPTVTTVDVYIPKAGTFTKVAVQR